MESQDSQCKRPYNLGKRQESSDRRRSAILDAAEELLVKGGFPNLTMEVLAAASNVTRQTIHNMFQSKAGVLEALFDRLAFRGGMNQMAEAMRTVMSGTDPDAMLTGYVRAFAGFWKAERPLLRRIRGIAAFDPEFEAVLDARNQRRRTTAPMVVKRLAALRGSEGPATQEQKSAALYAMTSFEYFDVLAEAVDPDAAEELLLQQLRTLLLPPVR